MKNIFNRSLCALLLATCQVSVWATPPATQSGIPEELQQKVQTDQEKYTIITDQYGNTSYVTKPTAEQMKAILALYMRLLAPVPL